LVSLAAKAVVDQEKPDLVLMGKQAVDGDSNQVAQRLAELLDWPMATFAATVREEAENVLLVGREVDGGVLTLRLRLPAVVSVDLRIVAGGSVRSRHTDPAHKYNDGVRFAPLPAIMAAKKKPLETKTLSDLVPGQTLSTRYVRFERPAQRKAGIKVKDVSELVSRLANEAKAL
jgi:electron transfer flavoprotein beta subunit